METTFSSVIKGHKRALNIIEKILHHGRLAHAYIFIGPNGVGKKLTALSLAKALNCKNLQIAFCGHCPSCRKIEKGIHPDVKVISPERGEIRIGNMRNLIEETNYSPLEARVRVFIIDDAHTLNMAASNAFLKTLEEPPEDTVIILITSSPDILPETVISRCEKIYFGPLCGDDIMEIIKSQDLNSYGDENIALMAEGSVRKAMDMLSEDACKLRKDMKDILTSPHKGSLADLLTSAENWSKDNEIFYNLLDIIRLYVRDLIFIKAGINKDYIANRDIYTHLYNLASRVTLRELIVIIDLVKHIHRATWRNVNRQLALEMLSLALWKIQS